eukprot:TRINITY_DN27517_c0_g1_i1.p1 TRINITY_DN27517_c0_g1~~TRINITY_DN27517_c0_g1_i1.p1  ORF type:complete len:231 (+),score=31.13 TRINITY_DN27517_c0_g1_i1:190-882(+)
MTRKRQGVSLWFVITILVAGTCLFQLKQSCLDLRFSVPPASLHPHAPWSSRGEFANAKWIDDNVFAVDLGNSTLSSYMADLCLDLEANADPEMGTTNLGGFHSKDLSAQRNQVLQDFKAQIDKPLSAFLHKHLRGKPPPGVESCEDLCISTVVQKLWVNVNRCGACNARHNHGDEIDNGLGGLQAVGVYYPSFGASAPATRHACIRFYPEDRPPLSVEPSAGTMLLFEPT